MNDLLTEYDSTPRFARYRVWRGLCRLGIITRIDTLILLSLWILKQ